MLTLLPDPISLGFVYQSAFYHISDGRKISCRVAYYQVKREEESRIEFLGSIVEYRRFGELTRDEKGNKVCVQKSYPAFIRSNDLFLFAPKLSIEKGTVSDLSIEGDWELKKLIRSEDGDKLKLCESGLGIYSCPFSEMFRL